MENKEVMEGMCDLCKFEGTEEYNAPCHTCIENGNFKRKYDWKQILEFIQQKSKIEKAMKQIESDLNQYADFTPLARIILEKYKEILAVN